MRAHCRRSSLARRLGGPTEGPRTPNGAAKANKMGALGLFDLGTIFLVQVIIFGSLGLRLGIGDLGDEARSDPRARF